jgi:hypothetical protein
MYSRPNYRVHPLGQQTTRLLLGLGWQLIRFGQKPYQLLVAGRGAGNTRNNCTVVRGRAKLIFGWRKGGRPLDNQSLKARVEAQMRKPRK